MEGHRKLMWKIRLGRDVHFFGAYVVLGAYLVIWLGVGSGGRRDGKKYYVDEGFIYLALSCFPWSVMMCRNIN